MTSSIPASAAVQLDWVPADACTLPTVERPLRVAEFDVLFATVLRRVHRVSPTWLRLHLSDTPGTEQRTRELTEREASCCGFFSFAVVRVVQGVLVDVRVPPERKDVLDALERRAADA